MIVFFLWNTQPGWFVQKLISDWHWYWQNTEHERANAGSMAGPKDKMTLRITLLTPSSLMLHQRGNPGASELVKKTNNECLVHYMHIHMQGQDLQQSWITLLSFLLLLLLYSGYTTSQQPFWPLLAGMIDVAKLALFEVCTTILVSQISFSKCLLKLTSTQINYQSSFCFQLFFLK
jgi:hypothetical protein